MFKQSFLLFAILLLSNQAFAGFLFCESKLKKDYALNVKDAKEICNSKFAEPIKKIREKEPKEDINKLLVLLLASGVDEKNLGFEDALKKAKSSTDLEIKIIQSYGKKFFYDHIKDLGKNQSIEKQKAILTIVDDINVLPIDGQNLELFFSKSTVIQIEAFPAFTKKYHTTDAINFLLTTSPEKIELAKKLVPYQNLSQREYFDFIAKTSIEDLNLISELLKKDVTLDKAISIVKGYSKEDVSCGMKLGTDIFESVKLCSKMSKNEFCDPKVLILKTLLESDIKNSSVAYTIKNAIIDYDHFSKNHAYIIEAMINSEKSFGERSDIISALINTEKITAEDTTIILSEMKHPFTDFAKIKTIINKSPSIFEKGTSFYANSTAPAAWGHGSGPACDTYEGGAAISNAKSEAIKQCKSIYGNKREINCKVSNVSTGKGEMICTASVTVTSSFLKDNLKSCSVEDLKEYIAQMNKKSETLTSSEKVVNDNGRISKDKDILTTTGKGSDAGNSAGGLQR